MGGKRAKQIRIPATCSRAPAARSRIPCRTNYPMDATATASTHKRGRMDVKGGPGHTTDSNREDHCATKVTSQKKGRARYAVRLFRRGKHPEATRPERIATPGSSEQLGKKKKRAQKIKRPIVIVYASKQRWGNICARAYSRKVARSDYQCRSEPSRH